MPVGEGVAPAGGAFALGSPERIFIPEDFDSDARLMAETALQFCRGEVIPVLERLDAQEDGLMMGLVKQACDLGFGGPDAPEAYGGLGLPKALATRILEMLSLNGSFSTTIGVHQGVGQAPITLFGSEHIKSTYLPPLTRGDYMAAYALSEPNSGSDALSAQARAIRAPDGSFRISGTKMWISNAKWAGSFVVFAKIDGERFTSFVVTPEMPGVSISREEHKIGLKGSSTARLILDDAVVPAENLLHEDGQGHKVAFNTLNLGRCKLAAMALGQCRSALAVATRYAKDRKQFGKPLSHFGLIRDKLARIASTMYAAESMVYRTANLIDHAFASVESPSEPWRACEEYQVECSAVKVFATEALSLAVDEALQIHGGYGFTEEFPVGRLYRDARVMRIYEGTSEINRLFIFDRLRKRGLLDRIAGESAGNGTQSLFARSALAAAAASDQETIAAVSDAAISAFADQSAWTRSEQLRKSGHAMSGVAQCAARHFRSMAEAFSAAKLSEVLARTGAGGEVSIPAADYQTSGEIAEAVLEAGGYPF
jgi:alkylation response protein AidB-like acyl-CoA dehydrogenase